MSYLIWYFMGAPAPRRSEERRDPRDRVRHWCAHSARPAHPADLVPWQGAAQVQQAPHGGHRGPSRPWRGRSRDRHAPADPPRRADQHALCVLFWDIHGVGRREQRVLALPPGAGLPGCFYSDRLEQQGRRFQEVYVRTERHDERWPRSDAPVRTGNVPRG